MTKSSPPRDSAVGYANPPQEFQFRPGQSGNPRGRPKRAPSMAKVIRDALLQNVEVNKAGRRKKMSVVSAIVQQLVSSAARGDIRATKFVLSLVPLTPEIPPISECDYSRLTVDELETLVKILQKGVPPESS